MLEPIKLNQFLMAIETDIVTFSFTKKTTGSHRIAVGTRNLDLIPLSGRPKGTGQSPPSDSLAFYDWNFKGWRSCKIDSLFGDFHIDESHAQLREISDLAKLI